ncbi:XdhC family protein [Aquimarina sp. I32.4]|uniref:XdhC family protein n=1 Tax=Aquimarina sp. I32.4 TaxID=2053903 RepID=UPI000CDF2573|nr:XdhC/CoxI family protein [Aquimarina sp. I32.4]
MTHEFKEILESYQIAKQQGITAVMATVVDIEGSSYRRPGVGVLILQNGNMTGAVSGGCVEKEVWRQAQSVFVTGTSKMMTYDGKYRLGCEGVLYILIEPFDMTQDQITRMKQYLISRTSFEIESYYSKTMYDHSGMGSMVKFTETQVFSFSYKTSPNVAAVLSCFTRKIVPCFKLLIIGTEHDAIQLCQLASATGWEVDIVSSPKSPIQLDKFPGAQRVIESLPENLETDFIDDQTAIVLMSHNFAKDLLYLQVLTETCPAYIGLLGPSQRREKLLFALIEYFPEITDSFLDTIHGPAGLNLGAETPQEIAISIIAEILSVIRNQEPISLQEKSGAIHDHYNKKTINVISTKT